MPIPPFILGMLPQRLANPAPANLTNMADLCVEIAFASTPWSDSPIWTEVTPYMKAMPTIDCGGRDRELDDPQAGRFEGLFLNTDSRFTPENSSSPYYPNVVPGKQIRIRGVKNGVHYFIWQGQVDGFPPAWQQPRYGEVKIIATNGPAALAGTSAATCPLDLLQRRDGATHRWKLNDGSGITAVDDLGGLNFLYQNSPTLGASALAVGSGDTSVLFPSGVTGRQVVEGRVGVLTAPCTFEILMQAPAPVGGVTSVDPNHENNLWTTWLNDGASVLRKLRISNNFNPAGQQVGAVSFDIQSGVSGIYGTTRVDDGAMHHIGVVFDFAPNGSPTIRLYVDGNDETNFYNAAPESTRVPWSASEQWWAFGNYLARAVGDFDFANGMLAYATFYPTALTAAQMAAHSAAAHGWASDHSGERVTHMLDGVNYPASKRSISTGATIVTSDAMSGTAADYLLALARTEDGFYYADGENKLTWISRHDLLRLARHLVSQATFLDDGTNLSYSDIATDHSKNYIKNSVTVTRNGGKPVVVRDAASISANGERTASLSGLLHTTENESLAFAQWIIAHAKDPALRFNKLVLKPRDSDATKSNAKWAQALGRQNGDRVTAQRTGPSSSTISKAVMIERRVHHWDGSEWVTDFATSPADPNTYWVLGVAGLGVDTRLAY